MRLVFHRNLKKMVKVPYYRLNVVDEYNMHMNSVDRADQLRGVYKWDLFMRKRKWWWSILFWCMQMLQTNAYVAYCKYMKLHNKKTMSHLAFCKQVALAWLDPENNWTRINTVISSKRLQSESVTVCSGSSERSGVLTRSAASNQEKKKRARRFTDASLDAVSGSLKDRLHQVQHWPVTDSVPEAGSCQLHRWASGGGKRRRGPNLFFCSYCEVTLCGRCFLTYHTVTDLFAVKKQLRIEVGGKCEEITE